MFFSVDAHRLQTRAYRRQNVRDAPTMKTTAHIAMPSAPLSRFCSLDSHSLDEPGRRSHDRARQIRDFPGHSRNCFIRR